MNCSAICVPTQACLLVRSILTVKVHVTTHRNSLRAHQFGPSTVVVGYLEVPSSSPCCSSSCGNFCPKTAAASALCDCRKELRVLQLAQELMVEGDPRVVLPEQDGLLGQRKGP